MFAVNAPTKQEAASPLGAPAPVVDRTKPSQQADPTGTDRTGDASRPRMRLAAIQDAVAALNQPATWQSVAVTGADSQVMTVSADQGAAGSHTIDVNTVATPQEVVSASFSSLSTVVGIGTLDIQLGAWDGSMSTFATNPNWPKASVTLGPKDNSLEHIRDRINAAGVGVTAMVVSDATGSRLVLRSTETGQNNGFKVTATPSPATDPATAQVLSQLAFDPGQHPDAGMRLNQAASDASVTIDDRPIQSSSNVIQDATSGLTLALRSVNPATQTITVSTSPQAVVQHVGALVDNYNQAVQSEGPAGTALSQAVQAASARLQAPLAEVGVTHTPSGQLSLDPARLQQALQHQPDLAQQALGQRGLAGALAAHWDTPADGAAQPMAKLVQQGYEQNPAGASTNAARLASGSILSIEA